MDSAVSNKRICVFCECWETGGIESFLFNVVSNMDLNGLEIDVVVSQFKAGVFSEKMSALGVNFRELSGSQRKIFRNHRMFRKILKERQYDVVHLNIFHALSFVYGRIAKKCGIRKIIAHSHNSALRRSWVRAVKLAIHDLYKMIRYRSFTDFWACSSAAAEFMFPKSIIKQNKYTFIPNGIDVEKFAFDSRKRNIFREKLKIGDKLLIVNIGRLCYQKNQSFLLNTAKCLTKRGADFTLLFVGDGDMINELREKADKLQINKNVIFFGTTSDVPSVLSSADVFVFPSLFEGLGIAAVEAQAAALPVICSENVPNEAFITERAKAVPLDAELWCEEILNAAKFVDRSNDVIQSVKRRFDIKYVSALIEEHYRK